MDYCVICGRIVPEGTHVCVNCRHAVLGTSMGTESETGVVMEEKSGYNKKRNADGKVPFRSHQKEPYQDTGRRSESNADI
ncbi:hypothetical protein [Lachnoclostridium sp. An118]|uniref:hypothetical protein n=1 Tax=Lachnoclostridium sp. An118 TaxID=1965547 RepID=UPI000B3A9F19|nr:hypothetical protein [Lachnoclostridium sp. An118]OUQ48487.1 hypothetical protein B5E62_13040 [Lachnoclostridium sp. An118]